jgi:poly(3-hydroxybutyrate) depolymerase
MLYPLYSLYELNRLALTPWRAAALAQNAILTSPLNPLASTEAARNAVAAGEVFESVTRRYMKPAWDIAATRIGDVDVPVTVKPVWESTWCALLKFERDPAALRRARGDKRDPRVLLVAPLSGHYATLLRGTVETFLPDHEVYITDWTDARMAPIFAGRFDLHDYIDHVRTMLGVIGAGANVIAVCQPGPPVLAAVTLMEEDGDPALPATMAFMGSPIDARRSPTAPNLLAMEKPFPWFEENMIRTVPPLYPGAFRRVYPGFVQLANFMGMNLSRHVDAHWEFFNDLVAGDGDEAQKHRAFYEEYLSVMDLTEEFYLQTIRDVFQEHLLPRGAFTHRGRAVRPERIRKVALMTIEGEKDDIAGIGQTQAAHDLCAALPADMRLDYVQPGVGHYGVFNGRRFSSEIYPKMRAFIRQFAAKPRLKLVSDAA